MSTRTIWKFTVPVKDSQQIKIDGATLVEILDAKRHPGDPGWEQHIDIWAVVDVHPGSFEFVPIEMRGTGHPLHEERLLWRDSKDAHIATVIDGPFVWHIFHGGVFE